MKDKKSGYRVEDIVICMILLALIAATATPRFSKASAENKLPTMVGNLHRIRSQIQLYQMDHDGLLPGQENAGDEICCEDFVKAMTDCEIDDCGPYLKDMPGNPFVDSDAADEITVVNSADEVVRGDEETGWWFNTATGQFSPCDSKFHSVY